MNYKKCIVGAVVLTAGVVLVCLHMPRRTVSEGEDAVIKKESGSQNFLTVSESVRATRKKQISFELAGQENIILYQKNQVTVRYLKMDDENVYLTIENHYGKSLLFESDGIAVNGVMLNLTILQRIENGRKAEIAICWKEQVDFERLDEILFDIYYSEDGNGRPIDVSGLISIRQRKPKPPVSLPEQCIYNKKNVKIFYSGMNESVDYKAEASIIVQNQSDNMIYYSVYDGMINGQKAQWYGEGIVFPNCIANGWIATDDYKSEEIKTAVFNVIINKPHTKEILTGTNTREVQVKKDE